MWRRRLRIEVSRSSLGGGLPFGRRSSRRKPHGCRLRHDRRSVVGSVDCRARARSTAQAAIALCGLARGAQKQIFGRT